MVKPSWTISMLSIATSLPSAFKSVEEILVGQAFAKVSQLYPKHAKVPDSLYKLADVERRLGHTDKVKGILQQVVAQYPGTSAAQLAQRDLQRL